MSEDMHVAAAQGIPPAPLVRVEMDAALRFAATSTAHIHLNLACCKVEQAIDLLSRTGEHPRLVAELQNVAAWLDDTALRVTGQAVEAARF